MFDGRSYRKKASSVGLAGNDQCLYMFVYVLFKLSDSDIATQASLDPCPGFGKDDNILAVAAIVLGCPADYVFLLRIRSFVVTLNSNTVQALDSDFLAL